MITRGLFLAASIRESQSRLSVQLLTDALVIIDAAAMDSIIVRALLGIKASSTSRLVAVSHAVLCKISKYGRRNHLESLIPFSYKWQGLHPSSENAKSIVKAN